MNYSENKLNSEIIFIYNLYPNGGLVFTQTFIPWLAVSLQVTDDLTRFDF